MYNPFNHYPRLSVMLKRHLEDIGKSICDGLCDFYRKREWEGTITDDQ